MTGLYHDRLPPVSERDADDALLAMSKLYDRLELAGERDAALYVEAATTNLQTACRLLTGRG